MLSVEHVLVRTPPWVALILAYLLWQGVQSLRTRRLPLWRVMVVPLLFIVAGTSRILGGSTAGSGALLPWAASLVVFLPVALATGHGLRGVDRRTGEVTRPGSVVPPERRR